MKARRVIVAFLIVGACLCFAGCLSPNEAQDAAAAEVPGVLDAGLLPAAGLEAPAAEVDELPALDADTKLGCRDFNAWIR